MSRRVVNADEPWGFRGSNPRLLDASRQRIRTGRHGEFPGQPRPGFTTRGRTDGVVGPVQSLGRSGMSGREAVEPLDEDATRALRPGTEKSADGHPEPNAVSEGGFLGKATRVTAMYPPSLVPAGGTRGVGAGRGNPESRGDAIEVGADQATAHRSAQKQGQKQGMPPERWEQGNYLSHLRFWIIKSAGEPVLDDLFHLPLGSTWR